MTKKKRTFLTKKKALRNRRKTDRLYYDPIIEVWYLIDFDPRTKFQKFIDNISIKLKHFFKIQMVFINFM